MACLIATLPAEILVFIAESLETQTDRLNFAVSSRRLYQLIHYVSFQDLEFHCNKPTTTPKLHAFLQLILAQPAIALNVQSLSLWQIPHDDIDYSDLFYENYEKPVRMLDEKKFTLSAEVVDLVKHIAPHTPANEQSWQGDLSRGRPDPLAALLLVSLPNLQYLEFSLPYDKGYFLEVLDLACYRRAPFDRPPADTALRRLRRVSILKSGSQVGCQQLLRFLRLPSMRHIIVEEVVDDLIYGIENNAKIFLPHSRATVTELEIMQGLNFPIAYYLANGCKCLKSFKYAHYPNAYLPGGPPSDTSFNKLVDGLAPTVECLYLDLPPPEASSLSPRLYTRSYTALRKLRHLTIRAQDLLGIGSTEVTSLLGISLSKALPESLESLHLLGLGKSIISRVMEQVAFLLRCKANESHFPYLTKILLEEFTYDFDYRPGFNPVSMVLMQTSSEYRSAVTASEEAGVNLRFVRTLESPVQYPP